MKTDNQNEAIADEYHALLFGVRRSSRYHLRRRRFFELWHSTTNFVGVVAGSTGVTSALSDLLPPWVTVVSGAFVALASALDLVVGTAEMARKHSDLAARFIRLEQSMVSLGTPTPDEMRNYIAKRLEIEADEPPILRTLDRLCHNELCHAMGYTSDHFIRVPWYQRRLANFISFAPYRSVH